MLERIGRYEILERIAAGGQGTVYRARDTVLDRVVAIKVINQSLADDPAYLEALQREARLAAGLDHPNITTVHDFQFEGDTPYLVMEYVPDSLDKHLRRRQPLPQAEAVEIAIQICKALAYAHSNGVIHRDIKPQNVLLTEDGIAKVSDFGIARAIASSTQSRTTRAVGTPFYMAPEQWTGSPADAKADIYSLGVLLYELLTGSPPFQGDSVEVIYVQHRESPVPPIPRNRGVPKGLEDIVRRAMGKRPSDRFDSAGQMASALEALGEEPAKPDKDGQATRKKEPQSSKETPSARRKFTRRVDLILIAAITLAISGSVVAVIVSGAGSSSSNGDVLTFDGAVQITGVTEVRFRSLSGEEIPGLAERFQGDRVFSIERDGPLENPITISVELSSSAVETAAGFPSRVLIQHFVEPNWVPLDTSVDLEAGIASATVDHLSIFALTVERASTSHCSELPMQDQAGCQSEAIALARTNPFTPTPLPTPTAVASPTPGTDAAGARSLICDTIEFDEVLTGEIFNETFSTRSAIEANLIQSGCELSGELSILSTTLRGSGPLRGTIDGNVVRFVIAGESNDAGRDLEFSGLIEQDLISGSYSVPSTRESGAWSLGPDNDGGSGIQGTPSPTVRPIPATPSNIPTLAVSKPTASLTAWPSDSRKGTVHPLGGTTHDVGTQITVTAIANPGNRFLGWTGACSGTGSCQVTLDRDETVIARFGPIPPPTPTPTPPTSYSRAVGTLVHDPDANTIKLHSAGVTVSNFVAEAEFFNPYATTVGSWDYGFLLRRSGSRFDVFVVTSRNRWEHRFRDGVSDGTDETINSGSLSSFGTDAFDTSSRGSNQLKLVVAGTKAWVFINGKFTTVLNLGSAVTRGDVQVASGYFNGDEVGGAETRFEDFKVTSIDKLFGPASGNLVDSQDLISGRRSGVEINDSVIEAEFFNPSVSGNWSYGFMVQSSGANNFEAIFVRNTVGSSFNTTKWHHITRTGSVESSTEVGSGSVFGLDTSLRGSNRLSLLTLGNEAWLFRDQTLITKLQLGVYQNHGDVSAIASYFSDDSSAGKITRYEDFTVWSPASSSPFGLVFPTPTARPVPTSTPRPLPTFAPTATPTRVPTPTSIPTAVPTGAPKELTKVSLALDWFPWSNHSGLYVAVERGYFADEGLDVDIYVPGDP
ncbi:MAG: protein kinase, partial [Chloroflexi bacterium]|nr:protein kinase [Chloroflexota bacterium]